jgi:hypothetical protein
LNQFFSLEVLFSGDKSKGEGWVVVLPTSSQASSLSTLQHRLNAFLFQMHFKNTIGPRVYSLKYRTTQHTDCYICSEWFTRLQRQERPLFSHSHNKRLLNDFICRHCARHKEENRVPVNCQKRLL